MIKGKNYNITLAYSEVATLDEYLEKQGSSLERVTGQASFDASVHGVTIYFTFEVDADNLWDLVIEATMEEEEE